jgi:hypothetical protein
MNRKFAFTKRLTALLLAILPPVCLAQNQSPAPSDQVVFVVSSKSWSVYASSPCDQLLNLRLYSNGRIEYEDCQKNSLTAGRATYSVISKETEVQAKDVAAIVRLIEASDFPEVHGRLHSGLNLVDAGYTFMLTYYDGGRERNLEVINYDPDSKLLPGWLHKLMEQALEFKLNRVQ